VLVPRATRLDGPGPTPPRPGWTPGSATATPVCPRASLSSWRSSPPCDNAPGLLLDEAGSQPDTISEVAPCTTLAAAAVSTTPCWSPPQAVHSDHDWSENDW